MLWQTFDPSTTVQHCFMDQCYQSKTTLNIFHWYNKRKWQHILIILMRKKNTWGSPCKAFQLSITSDFIVSEGNRLHLTTAINNCITDEDVVILATASISLFLLPQHKTVVGVATGLTLIQAWATLTPSMNESGNCWVRQHSEVWNWEDANNGKV